MRHFQSLHNVTSNGLHHSVGNVGGLMTSSRYHFGVEAAASDSSSRPRRYVSKRYRRRYLKYFFLSGKGSSSPLSEGRRRSKKREKLSLNEDGEYSTKYGDWLHRANETVHVRDREMWSERMAEIRKKYRQEYAEKFGRRLAEFTRMSDAKQYELRLQSAQKKERRRLSALRVNALKSAESATKSRLRMEHRTKMNLIRFDVQVLCIRKMDCFFSRNEMDQKKK